MRQLATGALLLAAILVANSTRAAEEGFALRDGQRVVFFGDSITQDGRYVRFVEAYLITRFPDRTFTVLNRGISSETVSGLSEPDHPSPRPCALDRFTRDVASENPDVIIACFGMNDGIYHPFDQGRLERYQVGVRSLQSKVKAETKARLDLATPPPFDPYRRQVGDPNAEHFGYRFPAADYDSVLGRYSEWLVGLRGEGMRVAELHDRTNVHLDHFRRNYRASFHLAPDAVHPGRDGHLLMAQAILEAWHAPALVSELAIDARAQSASDGEVRDLKVADGAVSFDWKSPIPAPLTFDFEPGAEFEKTSERLNRYLLRVAGLGEGKYRLTAAFAVMPSGSGASWVVEGTELEKGIDLTRLAGFPTMQRSAEVEKQLGAVHAIEWGHYRAVRATEPKQRPAAPDTAPARAAIRELAQSAWLKLKIERLP